jgi:hypothetical protein
MWKVDVFCLLRNQSHVNRPLQSPVLQLLLFMSALLLLLLLLLLLQAAARLSRRLQARGSAASLYLRHGNVCSHNLL